MAPIRPAALTIPGLALALGCGPSTGGSGNGGETDTDTATGTDASTSSGSTGPDAGSGTGSGTGGSLDGWGFRRPIQIENNADIQYADAEVPINLEYDPDMLPDFADLRFTGADGSSEIPFWIESATDSTSALVWVAVPDLPASGAATIYVYYGNPDATPASDGAATFRLFDDFEDGTLDAALWTASGTATESSGSLLIETGAVYTTSPVLAQPGLLAEVNASWSGVAGIDSGIATHAATSPPDGDPDIFFWISNGGKVRIQDEGVAVLETTTVDCCADPDTASWVGIAMTDSDTSFTTNLITAVTHPQSWTGGFYLILGHLQGQLAGPTDIFDLSVHTAIVRTRLASPAAVSVGAEEVP